MASAGTRSYNGRLVEQAPVGVRGQSPWSLRGFLFKTV